MDSSYLDPDIDEETDGLKGTTSTYPANNSGDESAEDRIDEHTTPRWRRLTVTLSATSDDALPQMAISATHPSYSVSELPVGEDGSCTLWVPEIVNDLDFVLSFPDAEQDDVSLTGIAVGKQDTISIPIVVLSG
ncbi:hypothetical protein [Halocatena marina]|uniref:hypothetical protein n=1 Tax=Halocatena marina TaxID=2934937 RepID=UPI00200D694E|nr:hypothetical protein [Halocatena marina]